MSGGKGKEIPIVLKVLKDSSTHDVIEEGDKLSGRVLDPRDLISHDEGNALRIGEDGDSLIVYMSCGNVDYLDQNLSNSPDDGKSNDASTVDEVKGRDVYIPKDKYKPIGLINDQHDIMLDDTYLDTGFIDCNTLISGDDHNGLWNIDGLYFTRCQCPDYNSYVISTDKFPYYELEDIAISKGLRLVGMELISELTYAVARDVVTASGDIMGGSSRIVSGETYAVARDVVTASGDIMGGSSRIVSGETYAVARDVVTASGDIMGGSSRIIVHVYEDRKEDITMAKGLRLVSFSIETNR